MTISRIVTPGICLALMAVSVLYPSRRAVSQSVGDERVLVLHMDQKDIDSGHERLKDLFNFGEFLFTAKFTVNDGFGRPGATGNGVPTHRAIGSAPLMNRASGMDANSCSGCHNDPAPGGGGDFVNSVFVLGQLADPVLESIDPQFSNERNTLGMFGSGPIESLAVEMTTELIAIRESAKQSAAANHKDVTKPLVTKGVSFGEVTAHPDGTFDNSRIEGVDTDLIIKPFHQKGVVNSLRVFSNNAYNHHHGMEAVERFGKAQTGTDDFDGDGIKDELSVGDITAATLYQAALPVPKQVMPRNPAEREMVKRGEKLFDQVACTSCHRPALILNSPMFTEPNPYNPPGNLRLADVPRPFQFDMTKDGPGHRLERISGGRAVVRAYTDLKRHRITDDLDPFFANEKLVQSGVPLNVFLTRKLWDCGNSAPYGHRGDCTTIMEAIIHHAGEARLSHDKFVALKKSQQQDVIAFLKSLVVDPRFDGPDN